MGGVEENKLMVGFNSIGDFLNSMLGLKHPTISFIFSLIAVITGFITKYIYDDANAVYFLLFMIIVDATTGIAKSIKLKTFSSSRLPRILVIMLVYCVLLAIGWNAAKFSAFYFWLPSSLYGGFIAVLLVSIVENLYILGYIPKTFYELIKEKINIRKIFKLDDKTKKEE